MTTMSQSASRGLLLFLLSLLFSLTTPVTAFADVRVSESYGKLPLHFEANQGQAHEDVRFLSRGPGYSLYLTAGEAVLVLAQPNADAKGEAQPREKPQEKSAALRMRLVG